jgi:hypothetical protein
MVLGIQVAKIPELVDAHVAEIAEEMEYSNSKALRHLSVSTRGAPPLCGLARRVRLAGL